MALALVAGLFAAVAFAQEESTEPGKTDEGLVAWWSFDKLEETEKGVIVRDSSPNKLDGILSGEGKLINGKVGKGLECVSGVKTDILVKYNKAMDFTDAITMMVWLKPTDLQIYKGMTGIVERGGQLFRLCLTEAKPPYSATFQIQFAEKKWGTVVSGKNIKAGEWVHLAATYSIETGEMALYVNGKQIRKSKRNPADPLRKNKGAIHIASRDRLAYFQGVMDELKIYSRALKAGEIKAVYKKTAGKDSAGDS